MPRTSVRTTPPSGLRALTGLVALGTLATLELVRASGPLVDTAYGRGGSLAAAEVALVSYAAPGAVALLLLLAVRRLPRPATGGLLVGGILLAALRVGAQALSGQARVGVGLAAVAVAVAVLTLSVATLAAYPDGARRAVAALAAGGAGSVGLQLTLGTWDALWRHSALGWSVTVAMGVVLALLAVGAGRTAAPPNPTRARRLWPLGPLLALGAMMLANPAFAASQSGLPLAVAGPVPGVGLLLAAALLHRRTAPLRRAAGALAAVVLTAEVALVLAGPADTAAAGVLVLALLLTAGTAALVLVSCALQPSADARPTAWPVPSVRAAGAAVVVGLATIGPLLVHQLDYDHPLGVPNELVLILTAAALGVAGLGRPPAVVRTEAEADAPTDGGPVLLAAALLLVAGVLLGGVAAARAAGARTAAEHSPYTGRVMTWNLHYGVTPDGAVDLEGVARTIEQQDPDVVLLQEVSRGWIQGGGGDMATWLSRRLHRPFAFAPAADGQFGNVLLARGGLTDVVGQPLPYGAGPQHRSAVSARARVGSTDITVTSIHLQHRSDGAATRVDEVTAFLNGSGGAAGPRLLAGDLNGTPGGAEVGLFTRAGWRSAVDVAGDPSSATFPSGAPRHRLDWVLGRGVAFRDARVLVGVLLSDHLPVVATVR